VSVKIEFSDVQVWVNGDDRDGKLAFAADRLVGVFVRLNNVDGNEGKWFLEAGFGPAGQREPPTFDQLEDAVNWLDGQVTVSGRKLS
jgi:hypothetical protein